MGLKQEWQKDLDAGLAKWEPAKGTNSPVDQFETYMESFAAVVGVALTAVIFVGAVSYAFPTPKETASLITTPSIACLDAPIKGFTKPE